MWRVDLLTHGCARMLSPACGGRKPIARNETKRSEYSLARFDLLICVSPSVCVHVTWLYLVQVRRPTTKRVILSAGRPSGGPASNPGI